MGRKSYLGVDIGTSGIKVVELENFRGQPKLVTYGYAEAQFDIIRDQSKGLQEAVANLVGQVLQRSRVSTVQCIAALPTFAVFNSIISLPRMSRRDLSTAIKWEAKKFIPLPIEEMMLSWKILEGAKSSFAEKVFMMNIGNILKKKEPMISVKNAKEDAALQLVNDKKDEGKGEENAKKEEAVSESDKAVSSGEEQLPKNLRILLAAAPKNLVNRYLEIFKRANLNLLSLETEAFALSRSLIGVDTENVMIVDIGSSSTNICLIEKGVPILNRGLDIGGHNITKSISNSLNVNFDRAEQFKLDFGIRMQEQRGGIPDAIKDSLEPIIHEIQYVFELYQNQGSLQVDRVLLAGGSAFLPNLTNYLSNMLSVPVYIGNPWDRIIYPLDLKPVLESIGPQMAVSVGLAMRNISS